MEKRINKKILLYISYFIPFLYLLLLLPGYFPTYNKMFIDSGIYSYVAQEINRGKLLYKEIFEIKFPAVYYIYAFLFKIFPDTRWTLFFCDFFSNILIILFTFKILKNFKIEKYFGIIGILLLNAYRVYPAFSGGNLNEHFFLLFFLIALTFLTSPSTKLNDFFIGISFSFLFSLKQPYIIFALILLYIFRERVFNKLVLKYFFIGFYPIFFFFLFIWIKALPDSFIATITYPSAWSKSIKNSISDIIYRGEIFSLCGAGKELIFLTIPVLLSSKLKRIKTLFIMSLLALFVIYFSTPALYSHYFILIYIPLIIAIIVIFQNYPSSLIVFLLFLLCLFPSELIIGKFNHTKKSLHQFFIENDKSIIAHPLCFVVFSHIKEGETFIMIPDYPEVYFITKTRSPFRFYGFGAIIPDFFSEEIKNAIRKTPPSYVYLEADIDYFNRLFSLKPDEYQLLPFGYNNFYKFRLKNNKNK